MTYKKICSIGGGEKFAACVFENKINISYSSDDCFRIKTLDGSLKNPKLNKTTKIYGDACLPICNFFVVYENGKIKIKGGKQ